ncbi:MAG TPA: hypothetical protein VFK20_16930 [Vicinamibacterales bacterium]|nr:hypothetical protein [Vicinamibacterales bacterium]
MKHRLLMLVPALALAAACGQSAGTAESAATPISPSAVPSSGAQAVRTDVRVTMMDACDPETFSAVLGPGGCVRSGGVTFDDFIAQLTKQGSIGAWRFAPGVARVQVGQTFDAVNRGGEAHTFTEVAEFGGGIVPDLNRLSGVPNVAPECTALEPDDFVAPGATYHEEVEHTGALKFQCCIHPWMRLEAQATSR